MYLSKLVDFRRNVHSERESKGRKTILSFAGNAGLSYCRSLYVQNGAGYGVRFSRSANNDIKNNEEIV